MVGPRASDVLGESLAGIAAGMVQRAELRDTVGVPALVNEALLKAEAKRVAAAAAQRAGLAVEETERTIRPEEWPRVGRVDLVFSAAVDFESRPLPTQAFVELKWGRKDALWNCIWDVAKSSLVRRLELANEALVLGGFSDGHEWRHGKYGQLLTTREWATAEFQRTFQSDWRYWARPPAAGERHRTGPYRLPEHFHVAVLDRHRFGFAGEPWSLGLLAITSVGDSWIELDEWGQPA